MTSKGAKAPPVLKDGVVYSTWRHELEAWQLLTDLAVEKQAIQIYLFIFESYMTVTSSPNEEFWVRVFLHDCIKF